MTAADVIAIRQRALEPLVCLRAIDPLELALRLRQALWRASRHDDRALLSMMVEACERRLTTNEAVRYWYAVTALRNEMEQAR